MAQRIVMPSFGMYTAEGNLGRWLVPAGSTVQAGDLIVEVVTEKATYEVESPGGGILHPVAVEGENLTVEGLIGWLLAEGEAPPGSEPVPTERLKASPIARRLAAEKGIDLAALTGTGPGGRIVEADVLGVASSAPRESAWKVRERIPLTGTRKTIGERLRRTVDTAVSLTLIREVRVDPLAAVRKNLAISWDAVFVKIFAESLRERPELNAVIEGGEILMLDEVHVGFAVSLPDGLVVPVVRNADSRPLAEIAQDIIELADRAKAGSLRPQDVLGGTATVTNLGAFGVDAFTPVLNPPQSAILGVGRIAQRPVVEDGRIAVGWTCVLSLTFDHRVTDGAPAADLLAVLYGEFLRFDPERPDWADRDRFILSKGHGCAALYAVLAETGYFPVERLETFYQDGSPLAGHATHKDVAGVEVSTGSLGHGLSLGTGMALAGKRDGRAHRVWVLLSDGECDEGSTWEPALFAPHHRLDNLVAMIDYNKIQSFGTVKEVLDLEPLGDKWRAFGWGVREIDGHDLDAIREAYAAVPFVPDRPSCIVAHTI